MASNEERLKMINLKKKSKMSFSRCVIRRKENQPKQIPEIASFPRSGLEGSRQLIVFTSLFVLCMFNSDRIYSIFQLDISFATDNALIESSYDFDFDFASHSTLEKICALLR